MSECITITINGLDVAVEQAGPAGPASSSDEEPLLLLHGSFLSIFSWREVLARLAAHRRVIAFDRAAFGETARPAVRHRWGQAVGPNPYTPEAQADLTVALMDALDVPHAVLVGNSAGGTIALLTALRHPQRVSALVLVGAMVYSGYPVSEMPRALRALIPKAVGAALVRTMIGRLHTTMMRTFWHRPQRITPDIWQGYRASLAHAAWPAAYWELIIATHRLYLAEHLGTIQVPALVVSGVEDHTVPTAQSIRLARDLPRAGLALLPDCGHLPHEECPHAFVLVLERFLAQIQQPTV